MRLPILLFLIVLLAVAGNSQSVVVTSRKTTYTRPKPIAEHKRTFTVNYPKVRTSTPALSRKIESNIGYLKVLGLNVREELHDVQWLEEADYEVCYNSRGLLCMTLFMSGSGAYPSGTSKTVVIDLKTGARVMPAAAFQKLVELVKRVKMKQRSEIDAAIAELKNDPDEKDVNPAELFEGADITVNELNEFSVDDNGVTFIYDYNFPHVIRALQPDGKFHFTWAELSKFINPNGPFAKFIVE